MTDSIKELLDEKIGERLPKNAVSDWETNHFELSGTGEDGEYDQFWVVLSEGLFDQNGKMVDDCKTETGKRYGAVLDAAALAPKMEAKLQEIVKLLPEITQTIEVYRNYRNETDANPTTYYDDLLTKLEKL